MDIYIFKVKEYTTLLVGQYNEKTEEYYVQRGDGTKYSYHKDRIEYATKIKSIL